jgi:adenine-specific DNA-methyltransferase
MEENEYLTKFKGLLNELFQFEASDLDFGIYRILNFKREKIKDFIENRLPQRIDEAFKKFKDTISSDLEEKLKSEKEKILRDLGAGAFDANMIIKEEYKKFPVTEKYLELLKEKRQLDEIEDIKAQVYNDLYTFFSRYYEDGDFVPKYRYSIRGHKYAIPYNGEEVKLYWANAEQYYTKTGELFRDYTFLTNNFKIIFRVVEATEELGSNKATKERFFILDEEMPFEVNSNNLIVRFNYRELTEDEVKHFGIEGGSNTSKQEKINQDIFNKIKDFISSHKEIQILEKYLIEETKNDKPYLLYQLNRFTAKNTRDYFIHKNLKKFLTEQLDYFIKSEVLNFESLSSETYLLHTTRAKLVKEIGEDIIDFLSQIEDFQKKLWEKKKFVIKTEYVITTDRVPEEFYDEIWKNEKQRKEWEELGFEIPKTKNDLKEKRLPIDTKYFDEEFKFRLIEKLTENADLDDLLDGLLIKSENWQALNTILNKYKESIKTIYIDPPYNTGNDGFLYRDRYQHSTWLSMMENRLSLARELMKDEGVIFVSIANNANMYKESYKLGVLMDDLFEKRFTDIIWKRRSASGSYVINDITEIHEYIFAFGKKNASIIMNIMSPKKLKQYTEKDEKGIFKWHDLVIHQYTKEQRPNLFYGVVYNFLEDKLDFTKQEEQIDKSKEIVIYPSLDGKSVFTMTKKSMEEVYNRGDIGVIKDRNNFRIKIKKYLYDQNEVIIGDPLKSIIDENEIPWEIKGTTQATQELKELLGISFDTAKPVNLVKLLIYVSSIKNDIILDFFAGSGTTAHAVMKLNKEDGGKRKFILVEMADYFDTIVIPRVKKVAYSFNWKDGKPQDTDGIGGFFKYQILEQYEDTLDNIELNENKNAENLFKDEYLLKYFLDIETRESPYLLNINLLKDPFSYKLKVNLSEIGEPKEMIVDIPETFVYLLGMKVKSIKMRNNNGNKYLFIFGQVNGEKQAIVFRKFSPKWENEEFEEDRKFIQNEIQSFAPRVVYINGQSKLTDSGGWEIRNIESTFKRLMEA